MTYAVKPLDRVYVIPGAARYHRRGDSWKFLPGYSRCGLVDLSAAVEMSEIGAIVSGYTPCGRCWFRSWRERINRIRTQMVEKAAVA